MTTFAGVWIRWPTSFSWTWIFLVFLVTLDAAPVVDYSLTSRNNDGYLLRAGEGRVLRLNLEVRDGGRGCYCINQICFQGLGLIRPGMTEIDAFINHENTQPGLKSA